MAKKELPTDRWLRKNGFPSLASGGVLRGRRWVSALLLILVWFLLIQIPVALALIVILNSVEWAENDATISALTAACLILAVIIVVFGIDRMVWFSLRWFVRLLGRSSGRHLHLLPLLLVAVTFFFLGAETWQSVGRLTGMPLFLLSVLFTVLAVVFLVKRGDSDPERLAGFRSVAELRESLPAELRSEADGLADGPSGPVSLSVAQRLNLTIVSVLGRVLVALAVGALITVFFVVFGFLAVDWDTAKAWSNHNPTEWIQVTFGGHTYSLTLDHVRVAIFLGVFSAFYFVVSSASDTNMAESLAEDTDEHVRACLAVREVARRREEADHAAAEDAMAEVAAEEDSASGG